jgi:hypothetical protein
MKTGPPQGLRGSLSTFFALMVGTPGSPTSPPRGFAIDVSCIDDARSQISVITSQGGPPSTYLALMVSAPGPPTPPPRGPTSMFLSVDGECSRIPGITSQGARHQHFLALMVDAPESSTPPTRGPLCARHFSVKIFLGPCAAKDLER